MGIWTDNPVLEREVRGRLRLKRKGAERASPWLIGILSLTAAYFYARGMVAIGRGTLQDARDLCPTLVYGALALIVLLAPALASTAITQEREQQTWEALAITRLAPAEVLIGKWVGRQVIPWILIVLLLPYLAAVTVRGQVSGLLLPVTLAFLLVTSSFYGALGLLCSFLTRRTAGATAVALTIAAFLCIGTSLINSVFSSLSPGGYQPDSPILWLNPFYAFTIQMKAVGPEVAPGLTPPYSDGMVLAVYWLGTVAATLGILGGMVRGYHVRRTH